jgi:hypothetical protein
MALTWKPLSARKMLRKEIKILVNQNAGQNISPNFYGEISNNTKGGMVQEE